MTDAELIVLGLVAEEDRYGYQIEAEIEARNIRNWADIGFSSIYYILGRLERQNLVISRGERSAEGPDRKVVAITSEGHRLLIEQSLERLAQRLPLPSSFYVGLALSRHVDREAMKKALHNHVEAVSARLKQLHEDRGAHNPLLIEAMFGLGQRLAEAEKAWLEEFQAKLESAERTGLRRKEGKWQISS